MPIFRAAAGLVLCLVTVACGALGEDGGAASPSSGIQGVALVGPQCPVEVKNSPCPEAPYEGTFAVLEAASNDRVVTFDTDSDGRFRVDLAPGEYTMELVSADGPFPFLKPLAFTVRADEYTDVTIPLDSGIRGPAR